MRREAQGQVGGKGVELPYRLLGHPSPSISLGVFMEVTDYGGQIDYITGWRQGIQPLAPLPSQEAEGSN